MSQTQRVTQLMNRYRIEIHSIGEMGRILLPVLILIEMNIASVGIHFVGIESVRQDVPRPVERVT